MIRLTIRATDDSVAPILSKLMHERLAAGMSDVHQRRDPTEEEISQAFENVMVT